MCDESNTVGPPSATASISDCRNSRRASGSSAATGSSRTSRSGRFPSPSVRATCACWPPGGRSLPWAGGRLVEDEQVSPLPERERERDLCLLAAGERLDPLVERDAQPFESPQREVL